MPDEEWVKTLEDGRKVKFIYQELPEDGAFITAQIGGNEVVYSVALTPSKQMKSHDITTDGTEVFAQALGVRQPAYSADASRETKVRPARASSMAIKRSVVTELFKTYPSAPASRAARTTSWSRWTVKNTAFAEQPDSRSCLTASIPLSFGIEMSETMTSGFSFMAALNRDSPLSTDPTMSKSGSNRPWTALRIPGWSSASSTRIFRIWANPERRVPGQPI